MQNSYKTHGDIFRALINNKKIRRAAVPLEIFIHLQDDKLVDHLGRPVDQNFSCPSDWVEFEDLGAIEYRESFYESFYDSRHGEFYDFQLGTKAHEFALQNKSLTRAPSKDFVKKIPIYIQESP